MELQETQKNLPEPIKYRVAVHYGRIGIERHDIFGLDVNIATHMQQLAPPGGVCLSNALYVRLPEQSRQRYQYLGRKYLKNIPEPVEIYSYDPTPPASIDASQLNQRLPTARRSHLSPPPRLGIAEFQTFSDVAARCVFARIALDSLMRGLSRFRDLFAVVLIGAEITRIGPDRANSRKFLSTQMACDYLLHGSCIAGPRTLDLTVHLESLAKTELIWSGELKVDLKQQFDLIDAMISAEIVAPILYLERTEREPWGFGWLSDDEIRFRQAKQLVQRRTLESLDQARRLLSEIAGRCGEIGDVYIALAHAEHSYGLLLAGQPFAEALDRARGYANKAIEIDDLNPQAHAELALQEMFLKRQGDAAQIYQHALKLNPYDPMLRADWADCLVHMGRAHDAAPILEDILSGWPRDRSWVEWNLCDAYWALDQPDRIITLLDRHPDQPYVHRYLAASYAKLGKIDEAKRHAEKVREHQPGFSTKSWSQVVPFPTTDSSEEYAEFLQRAGL